MRITRRAGLAGLGASAIAATMPRALAATPAVRTLSNPLASPSARRLYAWLWSQYGQRTLTGQQESMWLPEGPSFELDHIERVTGRLPAILGLDYLDPKRNAGVNERAERWYRTGGIPSICWHWGAPDRGTGYDNSKLSFDLAAAFTPGTPQPLEPVRPMLAPPEPRAGAVAPAA